MQVFFSLAFKALMWRHEEEVAHTRLHEQEIFLGALESLFQTCFEWIYWKQEEEGGEKKHLMNKQVGETMRNKDAV